MMFDKNNYRGHRSVYNQRSREPLRGPRMLNKGAQQEMVGFVLIVVIVMIALMVYLVISITNEPEGRTSLDARSILDSVLAHTTDCAIVFEPDYDNYRDLVKSCHQEKTCSNLNRDACEYLNESLSELMEDVVSTRNDIAFYSFEVFEESEAGNRGIVRVFGGGNCTGLNSVSEPQILVSNGRDLEVHLRICVNE